MQQGKKGLLFLQNKGVCCICRNLVYLCTLKGGFGLLSLRKEGAGGDTYKDIKRRLIMKFWKMLLAVILGIFLSGILFIVFIFGLIGGIVASMGDDVVTVPKESMLRISTKDVIVDRLSADPLAYLAGGLDAPEPLELLPVLRAIEHAQEDDHIRGIVLEVESLGMGLAAAYEVREALLAFKESGKPIYAYTTGSTQGGYYFASVADHFYLHPQGEIQWMGMATVIPYFKRAFDYWGIAPQVVRHGKYKSAVEPFLVEKISAENSLQTREFLSARWVELQRAAAKGRGVSEKVFDSVAHNYGFLLAGEALQHHFVDDTLCRHEFESTVAEYLGQEADAEWETVSLADYITAATPQLKKDKKLSTPKVAILYAQGTIQDGGDIKKNIQGEAYRKEIVKLRKNDKVKAVVFRINSGGGSALASDIMWKELARLAEEKPLVVSMGDYAASGGYYIAAPAAKIVATPTTITGSIGVFGLFFTAEKLVRNRLRVNPEVVKTHPHSDMGVVFRALTETEHNRIQRSVEQVYGTFINRVAAGRNMAVAQVDSIGQGRVWAGTHALTNGLVDTLGGLRDAIALAAELAELDDYRTQNYPIQEEDPFLMFVKKVGRSKASVKLLQALGVVKAPSRVNILQENMEHELELLLEHEGIRTELPIMCEEFR